jgi:hypothetical protein
LQDVKDSLSSIRVEQVDISSVDTVHSWRGSIIVVVKGYMKIQEFKGMMRFSQNFTLAKEDGVYYIVNDILDIIETRAVMFHNNIVRPRILNHVDLLFRRKPPGKMSHLQLLVQQT